MVAVARRMRGIFLGQSRSWRIDASAELVRSNLILELGLSEEQFEILDTVQELLSDGSVAPVESITRISLGGPAQEQAAKASEEETSADVYLAAVPSIERTEYTDAQIEKALSNYSLLDHQPAGIRHLLQRTSALLADDMGLGKTRQAVIAAAIHAGDRPILVVTLSSFLINWQREIQVVYPDANVALQVFDASAKWMVINYERLGDYALQVDHFVVMVIDEAYRLKEPTAIWTRHGFDIAAKVPSRYLLTGTPVLNTFDAKTIRQVAGQCLKRVPLNKKLRLLGVRAATLEKTENIEKKASNSSFEASKIPAAQLILSTAGSSDFNNSISN